MNMGHCVNCGNEYDMARPIKFDGYEGTEFYCKRCPPEKWSKISVNPNSERTKKIWGEIFVTVKNGALG
jgi:hypothetical protein